MQRSYLDILKHTHCIEAGQELIGFINQASYEIDRCFDYGVLEWKDRQDRGIDNRLQGIVTRTKEPVNTFDDLMAFVGEAIDKYGDLYTPQMIETYCLHKFINTKSHKVIEAIFCLHPRVTKDKNEKSPDTDIWIDKHFPFDIKVTTIPKQYNYTSGAKREETVSDFINDPARLIFKLYKEQGIHRWNWQNRLFIICYDADQGNHLELKSDFAGLVKIIWNYLDKFSPDRLVIVDQENVNGQIKDTNSRGKPVQRIALSDVIWNYRERQMRDPQYLGSNGFEPDGISQMSMF